MSYPKQPDNIDPQRQARAPYNFVELPDEVARVEVSDLPDQDRYDPQRFTGQIDCELTTASPLYVRCGLTPDDAARGAQAKDKTEFFYWHAPDEPVIPGTSLKGMLRALVEVAAYGKVDAVTDEQLVYRAVGDTTSHGLRYRERLMREDDPVKHYYTPLMRGGYMRRNGPDWQIQPAQEVGGTTFARIRDDKPLFGQLKAWGECKNVFEIYVKVDAPQYRPVRGGFIHIAYARVTQSQAQAEKGFTKMPLVISGWMSNKLSEAVIFPENSKATRLDIPEALVEAYREQISPEQAELLGPNGVLRDGQPVFYLLDKSGKVIFFGHCMMFRLPYRRSPRDFVPEALRRETDLDLAEALFGYSKSVGEGKARAYASRVSVSDASLSSGQTNIWLDPRQPLTPKILGSPKPTTFQHYLVQPTPNKFPMGQTRDGKPKHEVRLKDYAAGTPQETVIRGHKFYWHKGKVGANELAETKPVKSNDTQHTHIRPVRDGVRFAFQVRFENLSLAELGALLWVLQIAQDENYRLKLGMGKPLGMGAVKIASTLRLSNRQARYSTLFDRNQWAEGLVADGDMGQKAREAFEAFVLQATHPTVSVGFVELPRIRQLLALLSWPGPDPAKTRYLEIEHKEEGKGKVNEYKDRPVLPDPVTVQRKKK